MHLASHAGHIVTTEANTQLAALKVRELLIRSAAAAEAIS